METGYGELIVKIIEILGKNGFPEKKVSLPLEKMYEVAHKKGLNFNKVLEFLKEKDIDHEKIDEKIVFFNKEKIVGGEIKTKPDFPFQDIFGANAPDLSVVMEKGQEVLNNMTQEQIDAAMRMFDGFSKEQKQEMFEKMKDLDFFKGKL